jgi:hypothetical protein
MNINRCLAITVSVLTVAGAVAPAFHGVPAPAAASVAIVDLDTASKIAIGGAQTAISRYPRISPDELRKAISALQATGLATHREALITLTARFNASGYRFGKWLALNDAARAVITQAESIGFTGAAALESALSIPSTVTMTWVESRAGDPAVLSSLILGTKAATVKYAWGLKVAANRAALIRAKASRWLLWANSRNVIVNPTLSGAPCRVTATLGGCAKWTSLYRLTAGTIWVRSTYAYADDYRTESIAKHEVAHIAAFRRGCTLTEAQTNALAVTLYGGRIWGGYPVPSTADWTIARACAARAVIR